MLPHLFSPGAATVSFLRHNLKQVCHWPFDIPAAALIYTTLYMPFFNRQGLVRRCYEWTAKTKRADQAEGFAENPENPV
ncbi:protein of unknown function [Pseudomonas sp. JV241A]|nr:protein of unknown function [Pseudomonas sp. JV241A]